MFVGAVPKPAIEQITRAVPFNKWGDVFVGCSGSFRFDQAVKARYADVRVHSNDVSLLSVALGQLAIGKTVRIRFVDRLAFIQEALGKRPKFAAKVAAVLVASEMSRYAGRNEFAESHYRHYVEHFAEFHAKALEKVAAFVQATKIESFDAGDFRNQVGRAIETGGGIACFPPTYKGGYERLYKFLDQNVRWPAPEYGVWDPADLEGWVDELQQAGLRYCVITDRLIDGLKPITVYRTPTNKPVCCYASEGGSSLRRQANRAEPFRYEPVEPMALGPDSVVSLVPVASHHMNFLKERYLAKGIAFVSGMMNVLVLIDGRLAGGLSYSTERHPTPGAIYLISDFAIARERKLSKLVAMLSTSAEPIREAERRFVRRIRIVKTTAFTHRPVSMKYRGIFTLAARTPGYLNYASEVRNASAQEVYGEWFRRFAQDAPG